MTVMIIETIEKEIEMLLTDFEMNLISKHDAAELLLKMKQDNLIKLDRLGKSRLDAIIQKARIQVAAR